MLKDLQSKDRNKFVKITDIAITKVSVPDFITLSSDEAMNIKKSFYKLLMLSKLGNDSKEVALAYRLSDESDCCTVYGSSSEIEIDANADMWNILTICKSNDIGNAVLLHNHPTLNSFSLADVIDFIQKPNIRILGVVTNLGKCYYLEKVDYYEIGFWYKHFLNYARTHITKDLSHADTAKETENAISSACAKYKGIRYYN